MAALLHRFAVVSVAVSLASCGTISPNFGPDPTVDGTYQSAPTLPNAVKVAESMKSRYATKVEDQMVWERISGLVLIGAATIGGDLAIRGIGKSELIGLGVGAGGVYATSNWLASRQQQIIYAAGANAVQCSLDVMQPTILAYGTRNKLAGDIPKLKRQKSSLDATLTRNFAGSSVPRVVRAQAAVERARAILPVAEQSLRTMDDAGAVLRSSLSSIQQQVTSAVAINSADLSGLLSSLGQALPDAGAKIIGVSLPGVPLDVSKVKTAGNDDALDAPTAALEDLIDEVNAIVDLVRVKPDTAALRSCRVDLKDAGLTFTAAPTELSIEAGKTAQISLNGGVLAYRQPQWIGSVPPADQATLTFESGQGLVTVATKASLPTGQYTLLVLDAGRGTQTVAVTVRAAAAGTGGNTPTKTTTGQGATATAACTKNARVQQVQEELLKKGVKTGNVGGKDKPLIADGCNGDITAAAMRAFYISQVPDAKPDQIPPADKLLESVASLLGIK